MAKDSEKVSSKLISKEAKTAFSVLNKIVDKWSIRDERDGRVFLHTGIEAKEPGGLLKGVGYAGGKTVDEAVIEIHKTLFREAAMGNPLISETGPGERKTYILGSDNKLFLRGF